MLRCCKMAIHTPYWLCTAFTELGTQNITLFLVLLAAHTPDSVVRSSGCLWRGVINTCVCIGGSLTPDVLAAAATHSIYKAKRK